MMILKHIFLVLLVVACDFTGQVYGDDDDCSSINLTIRYSTFVFTDTGTSVEWSLGSDTNCSVEYRLTVTDEEFGIIRDEKLEETSTTLDAMSPCIGYQVDITAINKANSSLQGPKATTGIRFSPRVQEPPRLKALEVNSTSIRVVWALEGAKNRCPLKSLYLIGTEVNVTVPLQDLSTPVESVPVEITSLKPNSMYYFQVYVENSAGLSTVSQMAIQTLG